MELRAGAEPRRRAWEATSEASKHWIAGDGEINPTANAPRGWLRHLFYDAVRSAESRARVEALLPLAQRLDTAYGGDTLTRYVRTVAAADFRVRAPLAAAFRELALGTATLDDAAIEKLAASMRAAGMMDLWLGVRSKTDTIGRHMAEYRTAANATGDPWFAVLASHEEAKREIAAGNRLDGERRLREAADQAVRDRLEFRHLAIELGLSDLYLTLRRFPEAEQRAHEVLVEAQATGEWGLEQLAISRMAERSRFRYAGALSRGYLAEMLERDPESCDVRRYVHQSLANLAMLELDAVTARREIVAAPLCGEPLQLLKAMTWADVYRFGGTAAEARQIQEGLATLRASGSLGAGELALVDHVEGRLVVEVDRAAGRRLLRKAITEASGATDDSSVKARAYSFSILALDAGRAGEYETVLAVLAEEIGGSAPTRCAVGVAIEDERAIIVVRGADGAIAGQYATGRPSPSIDATSLIPAALVGRLDGCAEVSVLARPPLLGTARLLPDRIAWSYRMSGSASRHLKEPAGAPVVIADAEPPAYLELPRLLPYAGDVPHALVLQGAAATPARVVSAMRDAPVIEFHTHGFVDRGLSDASFLALTPDREGRYALTAAEVQAIDLRAAPLVILAACHAAASARFLDESVGLPLAFVRAGAWAVIASPATVNDAEAAAFFGGVRERIARGESPAAAVRNERRRSPSSGWHSDVIVYQ